MADTNPSPNMNLPIPATGIDPGPDFANNVNSSLTLVDGHDHSPGSGVPVTPAGLNISSDLSFNNNNATGLRSSRFNVQSSPLSLPADLGCLYVSGVDLYFNDENGNQVRITASGAVAGTPGSISNLTPPASASYSSVSSTFIFQSAVNTSANVDGASFILRDLVANSFGLTLSPPSSLSSNYTITLPALPSSTKYLSIDTSGNISAQDYVDNVTITNSGGVIAVASSGVGPSQLNPALGYTMDSLTLNGTSTSVLHFSANSGASLYVLSGGHLTINPATDTTIVGPLVVQGTAHTHVIEESTSYTTGIYLSNPIQIRNTVGPFLDTYSGNSFQVLASDGTTGRPIVMSAAPSSNALMIVRGNTSQSLGEGYSVSNTGTGLYTVTFSNSFSDTPVVTASIDSSPGQAGITSAGTTSVVIQTRSSGGTLTAGLTADFIAIGQRNS